MKNLMWQLFLQTGDVETYLLFKQLENGNVETNENKQLIQADYSLHNTKM